MKNQELKIKLREIRKASGLTQRELADISGVSFGTISQYETRGGTRMYVFDLLIRACREKIAENMVRFT